MRRGDRKRHDDAGPRERPRPWVTGAGHCSTRYCRPPSLFRPTSVELIEFSQPGFPLGESPKPVARHLEPRPHPLVDSRLLKRSVLGETNVGGRGECGKHRDPGSELDYMSEFRDEIRMKKAVGDCRLWIIRSVLVAIASE